MQTWSRTPFLVFFLLVPTKAQPECKPNSLTPQKKVLNIKKKDKKNLWKKCMIILIFFINLLFYYFTEDLALFQMMSWACSRRVGVRVGPTILVVNLKFFVFQMSFYVLCFPDEFLCFMIFIWVGPFPDEQSQLTLQITLSVIKLL